MKILTSREKALVRKLAQKEKAIFQIGTKAVHQNNIEALEEAFNTREILKVKVNREDIYDKEITEIVATELSEKLNCQIVGIIGTTIIIYKEHKDPSKRKVFTNESSRA